MCAGKEPVRSKVDRLIEARDRWILALQKTDQRSCNPESNEKSVYTRCGYPATLAAKTAGIPTVAAAGVGGPGWNRPGEQA
jgi:hypothetical protein